MTGYTGKKHKNYIWIPKPKSDLKEYRDILRLCKELEAQHGYFNDKILGEIQVQKGAIFDGSLGSKEYIKKYRKKSIGNQSYVSNARMSMRMSRFFGWITRCADTRAKYKLTSRGRLLSNFIGKFPGQIKDINELNLMTQDIIGMRFYCINDDPKYQNKAFKQRVMINILRFLSHYEYLHNYEIVITALTLKDEGKASLAKAFTQIEKLRSRKTTISKALRECGINPKDHSSLTGVYDGPKVLCSFLKQLGLLEPVDVTKLGKKNVKYYKKVYVGSPFISNVPKNVFKITKEGKKIILAKLKEIPIWYEDLPTPREKYAAAIILFKNNALTDKILDRLKINKGFFRFLRKCGLANAGSNLQDIDIKKLDFAVYRDLPPEKYEKIEKMIVDEYHDILDMKFEMQDVLFEPKRLSGRELCIKCHPPRCYIYKEFREVPNSSDYLAYKLCPNDSLSRDDQIGNIVLDEKKCVSCMLCLLSCPLAAINVTGANLSVNKIPKKDNADYKQYKDDIFKLEEITDQIIQKTKKRSQLTDLDRIKIVRKFENKISRIDQNWTQDEFYTWVRNCFRSMGLVVKYTGGKGMKTSSDVTIEAPFPVAIEIKSPAEGKVTSRAVRQTDDAAAQLFQKFNQKVYMCAIGQEISPEAKRKANEHKVYKEKSLGVKNFCIPLIPSKSLLYLTLIHREVNFSPDELLVLFRDIHGEVNRDSLKKYLKVIDGNRKLKSISKYLTEVDKIFS